MSKQHNKSQTILVESNIPSCNTSNYVPGGFHTSENRQLKSYLETVIGSPSKVEFLRFESSDGKWWKTTRLNLKHPNKYLLSSYHVSGNVLGVKDIDE